MSTDLLQEQATYFAESPKEMFFKLDLLKIKTYINVPII